MSRTKPHMTMLQLIGVLLILNAIAITFWWASTNSAHFKYILAAATLACLMGILLTLQRGYEFQSPIGTLKAEAEQDVHDIEVMKVAIVGHQAEIERQSKEAKFTTDWLKQFSQKASEEITNIQHNLKNQILLSEKLGETLENQKKEIDFLIADLTKKVDEARKSTETLSSIVDFAALVQRAQNDDRAAFDILRKMDNPGARAALTSIVRQRYTSLELQQPVPWQDGIKPDELKLNELEDAYRSTNLPNQVGLIQYVSRKSKLSTYEKVAFLMNVIKNDQSITAVEYAGRELNKITGLQFPSLEIDRFLKWWSENETRLKMEQPRKPNAP